MASMADKTLSTPENSHAPFHCWPEAEAGDQLGLYPSHTHIQNSTCLVLSSGWDSQCCPQLEKISSRERQLCAAWLWGFGVELGEEKHWLCTDYPN